MSEQSKNSNRLAPVKRETDQILYELVTVIGSRSRKITGKLGKMADAMILSRETCLNAVQKRKFQTTSKKVVRLDL